MLEPIPSTLDLRALGLQSAFAADVAAGEPWLLEHLGGREGTRYLDRKLASQLVQTSMQQLDLSDEQKLAMSDFERGAVCVSTGQQVGFLGGAFYNVYKIATALARVKTLQEEGRKACAVFWVEDNDHDVDEASKAWLYNREQGSVEVDCPVPSGTVDRISVSHLKHGAELDATWDILSQILTKNESSDQLLTDLRKMYGEGSSWTTTFVRLLQKFFAPYGLLMITGSAVRHSGFAGTIILDDLRNPGGLKQLSDETAKLLNTKGYHVQAEASMVNVFYHNEQGQRLKIQTVESSTEVYSVGAKAMNVQEMTEECKVNPALFSPSVLLRPLVQDYVLQSHEYIAGPSEVAYLALLPDVYSHFGLGMPRVVLRSGATLIGKRQQRLLDKDAMTVASYLKTWHEIETLLTNEFVDEHVGAELNEFSVVLERQLTTLREHILALDKSLDGSCGALKKAIEKEIDVITKKVRAALKRKNEERLQRAREIHQFVFPEGGLQERRLSPIYVCNEGGVQAVQRIIETIISAPVSRHYIISYEPSM